MIWKNRFSSSIKNGVNQKLNERTKIVLIFPNLRLGTPFHALPTHPSLSLGYLARSLIDNEINFGIIDASARNLSLERITKELRNLNPIYVGIPVNIALLRFSVQTAYYIRKKLPQIQILMGGPWATAQYEWLLQKMLADYVFLGESEHTLIDFLIHPDPTTYNKIPGLAYKTSNMLVNTGIRAVEENLDQFGYPFWEIFPKSGYRFIHQVNRAYPVITSRGCPYDCNHCTKIVHGYKMRYRSLANLKEEFRYLKDRLKCREIAILDDNFNINLTRAKSILRMLIKEKFGFRIQFPNGMRADFVDEEYVSLLKQAGTYSVGLGIESGSPRIIRYIGKNLDLKKVKQTVDLFKKYRIRVTGFVIMGFPAETKRDMQLTVEYIKHLNLHFSQLFELTIFPGTRIYNESVKFCKDLANPFYYIRNKIGSVENNPRILSNNRFSLEEYSNVRKYALLHLYLSPFRLIRFITLLNYREIIFIIKKSISLVISKWVF
jgi:radical SAM superfamily enzyme YgiQ (UPF0313 family)